MGGSQPGEGGLGRPWATNMSPELCLLLACLKNRINPAIPFLSSSKKWGLVM
jgi:hypothetical protein